MKKKIIVQIYFTEIFLMHRNKKLRRKRNNGPKKNFDVIVIRLETIKQRLKICIFHTLLKNTEINYLSSAKV